MFTCIDTILDLYARGISREFVVSEALFLDILNDAELNDGGRLIVLNAPHESLRYKYLHMIHLKKLLLICPSKTELALNEVDRKKIVPTIRH